MKDIVVSAILIAVGVIGLTHVDSIQHLYADAYPQSVERRQALERCAVSNTGFDRLDAAERANCYARLKVPPPSIQVMGTGREPQDDIRRLQSVPR
jgi:hypothetical protein